MTDLNYWFHGDDPAYELLAPDDPVDLHDDSGNNRVVSQDAPAFYTIGERTHPVLSFFPNCHYKVTATSQYCTLYAALRSPYFNGYRRLMQGHNDAVNVDVQSAPENAGVTLYSGSALSVAKDLSSWSVITGVFNDVGSFLIIDGVTYQQGALGSHTCDDFVLGGEYNLAPGNWFDGYLADIANFSVVHDDATLTLVLGEMMDFWGITKPTPTSTTASISNSSPVVLDQITVSTDADSSLYSDRTRLQWRLDGVSIGGATAEAYTIQSADVGKVLTCTVTPSNRWGDGTPRSTPGFPTVAAIAALQLGAPSFFALAPGTGTADLTWTEPVTAPLGYDIRWVGDVSTGSVHVDSPSTGTTISGLSSGENITFWIKSTGDAVGILESTEESVAGTIN